MDDNTIINNTFVETKTVEELKDLCRINNVRGYSRLRKDELRNLLKTFYQTNPEQLKEDVEREKQYIQNNKMLTDALIYEQQQVHQTVPVYIQNPVQEVVKHVVVQHLRSPSQSTQHCTQENNIQIPINNQKSTKEPKVKTPKAPKTPKEPKVKVPKVPKTPKAPKIKVPKAPKVKAPKAPKVKAPKSNYNKNKK
jgi:hypothetical protein